MKTIPCLFTPLLALALAATIGFVGCGNLKKSLALDLGGGVTMEFVLILST